MAKEFNALFANDTWSPVLASESSNTVAYKWIFCTKRLVDGSIERWKAYSSLFLRNFGGVTIFVLVYVDDLLVTSSSLQAIYGLTVALCVNLLINDLGKLHFFLGIKALFNSGGLILTQ
ncbi:uncharacterized mitochondrial protein AtMg00820-like [Juglans microcarpa x Juglans regia]|uniref:uncharacterized mitochondrial protein AtMg00820-like n=1 Tax=Juglans microcarpa x Juglans regia TaxID=2249226 RepID=UPI001B7E7ADA|nr:uncharacterized mitochondrial protein AtMg00820-like [Juglans microcarpa x Juglans regia]